MEIKVMRKMNRNIILVSIVILILCIGLSSWLHFSIINVCFPWNCAPNRDFDVLSMGIPNSFYPLNVDIGDLSEYDYKSIFTDANNASMGTKYPMHIVYNINRFTQVTFAEKNFMSRKSSSLKDFLENDLVAVYNPQNASEYFYQCGEYDSFGYMCNFIGRYEEFVISYFTTTDAGIEQVDAVVQYLDERMGKLLSGEEVEDWREIKGPYWEEWEDIAK